MEKVMLFILPSRTISLLKCGSVVMGSLRCVSISWALSAKGRMRRSAKKDRWDKKRKRSLRFIILLHQPECIFHFAHRKLTGFVLAHIDQCRSEEHTSELQSHSFISYAVFC